VIFMQAAVELIMDNNVEEFASDYSASWAVVPKAAWSNGGHRISCVGVDCKGRVSGCIVEEKCDVQDGPVNVVRRLADPILPELRPFEGHSWVQYRYT